MLETFSSEVTETATVYRCYMTRTHTRVNGNAQRCLANYCYS